MVAFAKKAGATDIKIYNMIGLPNGDLGKHKLKGVDKDAENLLSAKDVALISKYLVENYPETLDITKQKFANFDVTKDQQYLMTNVNALLPQNGFAPKNGEIDGLKTGNTDRAGKCIVSTGTFAGRRIILVALHTKGEWNDQSKMQQDFYNKLIDEYQPVEIKKVSDFSTKLTSVKVKNGNRYRVMLEHPDIYEREGGVLPVSVIDKPLDQRMARCRCTGCCILRTRRQCSL